MLFTDRDHAVKLGRAREHLESLEKEGQRWFYGNHYRFRVERDGEYANLMVSGCEPGVDPFSVLMGDCLHNLRSALDALAYELASAHTHPLPDDIAKDSEFPIVGDEDRKGVGGSGPRLWKDNALKKVRGMDPAAQAAIKGLQPYHRQTLFRKHRLWRLHDLDRINKHRVLHTVDAVSLGSHFDAGLMQSIMDYVSVLGRSAAIEIGGCTITEEETRFARFPWPPGVSEDEMKVKVRPAFKIVRAEVASEKEPDSIVEELAAIYNFIKTSVLPPLEKFLP